VPLRGEGCCAIYERRPVDPCRNIISGGCRKKPVPEEFKPDRLGVLFISGPVGETKTAYILRSAGRDPDEALLAWMREFS